MFSPNKRPKNHDFRRFFPSARQLVRRFRSQAAWRIGPGNARSGSTRSPRPASSSPLRRAASSAAQASTPCPTEDPDRARIVGIWGRLADEIMQCRAASWCLRTPPGRQSTCYKMLRCPVVSKIRRAMFSAQGNMNWEVTSKSRRPLVGLSQNSPICSRTS